MNTNRNPVGWFEIYVDDMDRAKTFYEEILATTLEPLPSPDSSMEMLSFPIDDETMNHYGAPGALCKMEGFSPGVGGTLVYFGCEDCATEEARVSGVGGSVLKSKFAIGEYGFISLIMDTEGNTVGLHSMQ